MLILKEHTYFEDISIKQGKIGCFFKKESHCGTQERGNKLALRGIKEHCAYKHTTGHIEKWLFLQLSKQMESW